LQEVILAKKATVVCGQHQSDWDEFRNAMLALYKCESVLDMITKNRALVRIFSMRQIFSNKGFLLLNYGLYGLLEFKASDPRDKVYAALGLGMSGRKLPLMPDYDLAVQEIYTNAARYLINEDQNLRCWINCLIGLTQTSISLSAESRKIILSLADPLPRRLLSM
jgi:hypothetical protein